MQGIFYYPKSAESIVGTITKTNDEFVVETDLKNYYFKAYDTKISSKLGNTPRKFNFPNGSSFECPDQPIIEKLQPTKPVYFFESSWLIVIVLAILGTSFLGLTYYKGVPMFANWVVGKLPNHVQISLGQGILDTLDVLVFEPSDISPNNKAKVQEYFDELIIKAKKPIIPLRLHFRSGTKLGANAIAIPDGSIVITDELLELAQFNKLAIQGVLAHEIGHINYRHSLRQAVVLSLAPIILALVTGDLLDTAQLAASVPIILLELGYSRDFERQSDQFARDLMWQMNKSTQPLANLLFKFENNPSQEGAKSKVSIFSTHPITSERVEFFRVTKPHVN